MARPLCLPLAYVPGNTGQLRGIHGRNHCNICLNTETDPHSTGYTVDLPLQGDTTSYVHLVYDRLNGCVLHFIMMCYLYQI